MLRNMKIRTRMILGFGLVVILMLTMGVVAYFQVNAMADQTRTLYERSLPVSVAINKIKTSFTNTELLMTQALGSKIKVNTEELNKKLSDEYFRIDLQLGILREKYLGDQKEIADIANNVEKLKSIFRSISDVFGTKLSTTADKIFATQAVALIENNKMTLDSVESQVKARAAAFFNEAETDRKNTIIVSIIFSAAAVILSIIIAFLLTESILRPLNDILAVIHKARNGDLTAESTTKNRKDEIGRLAAAFMELVSGFRIQIQELVAAIAQLAASSSEISATASQLSASASETAASISETAATVEEVKQTAQVAMDRAKDVYESAQTSYTVSKEGLSSLVFLTGNISEIRNQIDHIAQSILNLNEQSQAISEIISAVDDISEQSNLLAVNASIEAAKAGEQGKGFAVVAQEIKALANQSKQSTKQVKKILGDIQKATGAAVMATEQGTKAADAGVTSSHNVEAAIKNLSSTIEEATHLAQQISAASQQQYSGIDQVTLAMESINEASKQNVEGSKNLEQSAHDTMQLSTRLKSLIERYKI